MSLELGFYLCLAVAGWLTIGPLVSPDETGRSRSFALFGLLIGLWSLGELLVSGAGSGEERALARRIFFLGSAGLPPAWFYLAAHTGRPGWFRRAPWLVLAPFLLPAFFYSSLYWDAQGRFVSLDSPTPVHGPWFDTYVDHQYLVALWGTWLFAYSAIRMGRTNLRILAALTVGVLLPIGLNLLYLFELVATDWTAVALAPSALLLWMAVTESDLAESLPLGRRGVIDQLDVGVLVADAEGRIVQANPAAFRITCTEALLGEPIDAVLDAARQRDDRVIELRRIEIEGRFGALGHAMLLTDRTAAEAQRRRLELGGRLEALGSLTAGIAHEVNNPLTYIQANLSMLESTAKRLRGEEIVASMPAETREAVDDLDCLVEETQEGVERIRILVQRLGNFSRAPDVESGAVEVDITSVARQAASLASLGQPDGTIRLAGEASLRMLTNESAVFQILVNLLLNAVQSGGGAAGVRVTVRRQGEGGVVLVEDEGPGMSEEVLSRLFDPFFTTRAKGMGLGLSLSYDLATQIGARLEAANREGGGAVFTLRLDPPGSEAGSPGEPAGTDDSIEDSTKGDPAVA